MTAIARAAVPIVALSIGGCCGTTCPVLSDQALGQRRASDRKTMAEERTRLVASLMDRFSASDGGAPPTVHILAISGGGDWGAFGSGFLVGWGECSDEQQRRPQFDVVTGVSTGSILSPFAFLGTQEAVKRIDDFYRNPKPDWAEERSALAIVFGSPSLLEIPGLRRDVEKTADPALIAAIAERHRKRNSLLIAATDIDLGAQKIWDLGAICQGAVERGDTRGVCEYVLASSAVPVAFPPVPIDGTLYVDGCVTANVLLRLDTRAPDGFLNQWLKRFPGRPLPRVRYWIIINNQLEHIPSTVQPCWLSVLAPTIDVSLRSATIAQAQRLAAEAEYVNAAHDADIEVRVVAIPNEWRPPVPGLFKPETMRSLSDLGRSMGSDPNSWQLWVEPRRR